MQKTLFWLALLSANFAWAVSPADMLKSYEAASGKASSQRGEQLFNNKHGKEWSCSSCHTALPNKTTEHIVTGKSIEALAPSTNANRFTDITKTEKWFKRNCKDVFARECSAQEKADIVAWLLTFK